MTFKASQLTGYSSKVEVISETSIIGGTSNLASGSPHDTPENSAIFSALGGTGAVSNEHSQITGTTTK